MWHHRLVQVGFCIVLFVTLFLRTLSIAYSQEPVPFAQGDLAIITAADSPIPLWDAPAGITIADVIRVGALVQIVQVADEQHAHRYFVHSVTDRTRRGWIAGDALKTVKGVRNHIGNIVTCSEAAHRLPICGAAIPLTEKDALMLHFDYFGVSPHAFLQWVITVDGERYASRPMKLERTEGAHVLDLLDMDIAPHLFAGQWQIKVLIDAHTVHERNITILPAHPAPAPPLPRGWQLESVVYMP
jgi:hypothetical protein